MCKYCGYEERKKDNYFFQQENLSVTITINRVDMTEEIIFYDALTEKERIMNFNIPISYCPFCGGKLA